MYLFFYIYILDLKESAYDTKLILYALQKI